MENKILIIKHVEHEGPGLIADALHSEEWELKTIELEKGEALPGDLREIAAVIILGGPMNVYEVDKFPFLDDEEKLIRKTLIEEVPFLGICLGAQLLAKTCGVKVYKSPEREIGWYTVRVTRGGKKDILFRDIPERMVVFQWHEDTFEIPDGGILLTTGKPCKNQAFKIGSNAYGLQFHVEVTADMIREWMKDEKDQNAAKKTLADMVKAEKDFLKQAGQLLNNFKQVIESSLRIRNVIDIFIEEGKRSQKEKRPLWWDKKGHVFT
ncbi:MAG: GMP synthase (glutamine-hydrolyzing) [Syntrophorhabdus sp. PtaU1.Bin058]|nr:MAG: GMP synthase (glutamine-hydrolyzing) [Syntrophorhabdus sp. PtaU1.Bin058]